MIWLFIRKDACGGLGGKGTGKGWEVSEKGKEGGRGLCRKSLQLQYSFGKVLARPVRAPEKRLFFRRIARLCPPHCAPSLARSNPGGIWLVWMLTGVWQSWRLPEQPFFTTGSLWKGDLSRTLSWPPHHITNCVAIIIMREICLSFTLNRLSARNKI